MAIYYANANKKVLTVLLCKNNEKFTYFEITYFETVEVQATRNQKLTLLFSLPFFLRQAHRHVYPAAKDFIPTQQVRANHRTWSFFFVDNECGICFDWEKG